MGKPMTTVEDDIYLRARTDGSFATAYALLKLATELGHVAQQMNEFRFVFERSVNLTGLNDGLRAIAMAVAKLEK